MQAPTSTELLKNPEVQRALEQAWADSLADDPALRHEEGGWIFCEVAKGAIMTKRAPSGKRAGMDLGSPPIEPGFMVVGTFHTHPNPTADGWRSGPSELDKQTAQAAGVPFLIRADDGDYSTGPDSRRGGMAGNPGYPT